jgi:hypothetical protein
MAASSPELPASQSCDRETRALSLASKKGDPMEKRYWLRRSKAESAMARAATDAEARLIHFNEAGRYSVMAEYWDRPFLLGGRDGPASDAERAALRHWR